MAHHSKLVVHPDNSVHLTIREGALPRGMSTHEVKVLAVTEFLAQIKKDVAGLLTELLVELKVDVKGAPPASRQVRLTKELTSVVDRFAEEIIRS